jgi:hypothetical protein
VLLTASGLLLRSFEKMRAVDVDFRPDHTLTALYGLPSYQYRTQASIDTDWQSFNDIDGTTNNPWDLTSVAILVAWGPFS